MTARPTSSSSRDITGDTSVEPNETINLILSTPAAAATSTASGTAMIGDVD